MVESKELIFDVAKNIKKIGAHFMRGGAFKPLTFPYRSKKYNETLVGNKINFLIKLKPSKSTSLNNSTLPAFVTLKRGACLEVCIKLIIAGLKFSCCCKSSTT